MTHLLVFYEPNTGNIEHVQYGVDDEGVRYHRERGAVFLVDPGVSPDFRGHRVVLDGRKPRLVERETMGISITATAVKVGEKIVISGFPVPSVIEIGADSFDLTTDEPVVMEAEQVEEYEVSISSWPYRTWSATITVVEG